MAAAFLGYAPVLDADGNVSQSVTIPAGTDYCVAVVGGFVSGGEPSASVMTLAGVSMLPVKFTVDGTADSNGVRLFGCNVTTSGSQTYAATWSGAWTEGGGAILLFCSGIDQTTAVRDSDGAGPGNGPQTVDKTLTTESGDLCIGAVWGYQSGPVNVDLASQTNIFEENTTAFNSDLYGAAYKMATTTSTQMQFAGEYTGAAMVALIPAGGGGGSVLMGQACL